MDIQENASLQHLNTFKVEAKAKYLIILHSTDELFEVLKNPKFKHLPKLILSNGSNILFTQNFNGVILKPKIHGIKTIREDSEHTFLKVGSGESWNHFIDFCIEHHYAGTENLSDIPGAIGSAASQNIGAYGVEISQFIESVEAIDLNKEEKKIFNNAECQFGYRKSIFKKKNNPYMIVHVTFKVNKKPRFNIEYKALKTLLKNEKKLTLKKISNAIISIRQSKLPDTNKLGNAGSFFSNPVISKEQFEKLLKTYPDMLHWMVDIGIKISAAWLIEQCGFKGKRFGDAGVHENHALVLVNYGHATGKEIKQLAEKIQQTVFEKFQIHLEPEVIII